MPSNPHDMPGALYDEASARVGNHAHEILFGLTYEHVSAGQRLLDVGIGTGLSSVLFHRAGLEIEGVDFAEGMLDACRRKGIARRLTVHDLSSVPWPFGDASFDHVTCCGVLHFVHDIAGYLDQVQRILRVGGTFGFTVMDAAPDHETEIVVYAHSHDHVVAATRASRLAVTKQVCFSTPSHPGNPSRVCFRAYLARHAGDVDVLVDGVALDDARAPGQGVLGPRDSKEAPLAPTPTGGR